MRSYILSDLLNLQQSTAPYKLAVRHRLARFNISQDISPSTSGSYEHSSFSESGAFGSEISTDLIYTMSSNVPKQVRTNLTIDIFNQIINLGEIGIRSQNVPALLRNAVASHTLLGNSSIGRMLQVLVAKLPKSLEKPEFDLFYKVFGQEILYDSFTNLDKSERDIISEIITRASALYFKLQSGQTLESFYGFQFRYDVHVSTIQGIPLMITQDITTVASLNAVPKRCEDVTEITFSPILAVDATHFVGYRFGPSAGIECNTTVFTSSESIFDTTLIWYKSLSVKVDIPRDVSEVLEFRTHSSLVLRLPGEKEQIVADSSQDPRYQSQQCSKVVSGLKMCYEYNLPNLWAQSDFPLVKPSYVKVTFKKDGPIMKGFDMALEKKDGLYGYQFKLLVPGTPNPTKMDIEVDYEKKSSEQALKVQSMIMERRSNFKVVYNAMGSTKSAYYLDIFTGKHLEKVKPALSLQCQINYIVYGWVTTHSKGHYSFKLFSLHKRQLRLDLLNVKYILIKNTDEFFNR